MKGPRFVDNGSLEVLLICTRISIAGEALRRVTRTDAAKLSPGMAKQLVKIVHVRFRE
jgi:hypothetical protein